MFYVYIIYSKKIDKFYIGYTGHLADRLAEHLSGLSLFTAKADDWKLQYSETFPDRQTAMKREREIKKKKSRKYIEWLVSSAG